MLIKKHQQNQIDIKYLIKSIRYNILILLGILLLFHWRCGLGRRWAASGVIKAGGRRWGGWFEGLGWG
ncbi:hypothetical protein, partial [Aeromonas caviae]|uniref:hypothetical protein n=1 Tax=Aeromonas caviae TaxID=648 RepID=UPI001F20D5FC